MNIDDMVKETADTIRQLPVSTGTQVLEMDVGDVNNAINTAIAQTNRCVLVRWNGFKPVKQGNGSLIGNANIVAHVYETPAVSRAQEGAPHLLLQNGHSTGLMTTESNGGKVVAVSALTLSQNSSILSPRKETLDELKAKWPDIDTLLRDAGVADSAGALTENQARYILKFSPDTFRNRAAAQGVARGGPSLAGAMGASASVEVGPADERQLSPENPAKWSQYWPYDNCCRTEPG